MDTSQVIVVGAFGEVIELCQSCSLEIVGIIDPRGEGSFQGYPILGSDRNSDSIYQKYSKVPLVLTPDQPLVRQKLADQYSAIGFSFLSVSHPSASVSASVTVGRGVLVHIRAHVSSEVSLGDFVRINACANIMHDCAIGSFTTIAPSAVLLGRVEVREAAYIGANATILPNLRVGKGAVVGAGAVVTRNVPDGHTVVGNPARVLTQPATG